MRRRLHLQGGLQLLALALAASPAAAAPPTLVLRIPLQDRTSAVLALGQAANVSIGFRSDARCAGEASAVGRMTAAEALDRLLAGSNCRAITIDDRTFVVVGAPRRRASTPNPGLPAPAVISPSTALGELVVTAGKRRELLQDTAYSLTAASRSVLEGIGAIDAGALPSLAAGITVTNLGPGRDKILVRGLSDGPLTGHTQSTVGIYLDDLRLTYNAPDPDLRWTDVKQIELLEGPQGSLYGAGSIGGVLRIVTNAPDPSASSGSITAAAEATRHGAASSTLEGYINQPIGAAAAVRVAGWTENDGGYIDNLGRASQDTNRTHRDGLRVAALWEPTSDLTVRATIVDQSINTRDAQYIVPAIGPLARSTVVAEPHDNDFRALDLTTDWKVGVADVTATLGLIDHEVVSSYDASQAPAQLTAGLDRPSYVDDNHIRGFVTETRIASLEPGAFQWLIGAFGALGEQNFKDGFQGIGGGVGYSERRRDKLFEGALFGETSVELSPKLTVTAGGRLFFSDARTRAASLGVQTTAFGGATHDTGFAPKLSVAYRLRPGLNLYAQAASGYRSSGFNTGGGGLQVFAISGTQPLRRYSGDQLLSYEGGVRETGLNGALQGRAAVFYAVWRDIQSDLLSPNGLPFTANIGDGRTVGLEGEIAWARGRFSVAGNGIVEDAELDRPDPGFPARSDATLPGVPTYSFSARSSYVIPLKEGRQLRLAGEVGFVGPSHLTFDATTAPVMGDYVESRLRASLEYAHGRLTAYVSNLADSRGDTFAYGNPFSLRSTRQSTPQRPVTVGVSATQDF